MVNICRALESGSVSDKYGQLSRADAGAWNGGSNDRFKMYGSKLCVQQGRIMF